VRVEKCEFGSTAVDTVFTTIFVVSEIGNSAHDRTVDYTWAALASGRRAENGSTGSAIVDELYLISETNIDGKMTHESMRVMSEE
jgi:hypothetical protein